MTLLTRVMGILGIQSKTASNTCKKNLEDVPGASPYLRQLEHHKKRLEVGGRHDDFHRHMISHCERMLKVYKKHG